jgi:hypothetical protein
LLRRTFSVFVLFDAVVVYFWLGTGDNIWALSNDFPILGATIDGVLFGIVGTHVGVGCWS